MSRQALMAVHTAVPFSGQQEIGAAPPYARTVLPTSFNADERPNTLGNLPFQTANLPSRDSPALSELNRPSRWWETEAVNILQSEDPDLTTQVLRFRLYGTTEFLCQTLQHLSAVRLNDILNLLQHRQAFQGNKEHQVNKIIELVEPRHPLPASSWPARQSLGKEPIQIADEINRDSRSMLEKIDFTALVRYALGYAEDSVQNLFAQHGCISVWIRWYLYLNPRKRPIYIQVEEHLQNQSPLAHQAVAAGLLQLDGQIDFNLEDICAPLREYFQDNERSLSAILLRLPALALRFERIYRDELLSEWPTFSTETDVFDALLTNSSACDCAKRMTLSDKRDFDLLSIEDFKSHGPHSKQINIKWNDMACAFAECYKAYPRLTFHLDRIAKVLRRYRNWHRVTALECGRSEARPEDFARSSLVNNNGNYAVCRAEMRRRPGLPFLFPLYREYRTNGDTVIEKVFSFIFYDVQGKLAPDQQFLSSWLQFIVPKRKML